jgi:glutamate/tyrosine decarboxylase-like PLP-dependent enzyme
MRDDLRTKRVFDLAKAYAFEYMDIAHGGPVFPGSEAINGLDVFDEPMPEGSEAGEEVLALLHEYGSPATVAQTGGRYFGFVNGGVVPTAAAASWLAGAWDQNTALYAMSTVSARLESVCERWLVDLLGLPLGTAAGLVGGSSVATLCGLAAARHALLRRLGWDVNLRGLRGAPRLRVVASEHAHVTVFKALALLGIGRNEVDLVGYDSQGRIDIDQLPTTDERTLLLLQAGNVNTGAFDRFSSICPRAREAGSWVHVDGAFGLWASASARLRYLTDGVEFADSWSVDGHKTLNTPYDCGIVLCRDRESLVAALEVSGSYLPVTEERDGMLYGPDMSRRARSVELWATLKYFGRTGVAALVEGLCDLARQFGRELERAGFRVLADVVFTQVLVAAETPQKTAAVLTRIQNSGELWCGGTTWQGEPAIRISVCSWATTEEDVRQSVDTFVTARDSS